FLEVVPEVLAGCVGVSEFFEVFRDPLLELVGSDVRFDHPEDARALAVADLVEQLLDLFRILDARLDRMRASQAVPSHCSRGLGPDEVLPDLPLRIALVDGVVAHEGGDALVEPDVVPPFHGAQVAAPYLSNLMSNDTGHRLLRPDAGILVDVHEDLAIGNRPPVLHRTI